MVPEDYLMALVTAAAARLPQPVDQEDLEHIRSTLWDLLIKVTQGPCPRPTAHSSTPTTGETCRLGATARAPPLLQPELLRCPGQIATLEPTTQRALELHLRSRWAEPLTLHPIC